MPFEAFQAIQNLKFSPPPNYFSAAMALFHIWFQVIRQIKLIINVDLHFKVLLANYIVLTLVNSPKKIKSRKLTEKQKDERWELQSTKGDISACSTKGMRHQGYVRKKGLIKHESTQRNRHTRHEAHEARSTWGTRRRRA